MGLQGLAQALELDLKDSTLEGLLALIYKKGGEEGKRIGELMASNGDPTKHPDAFTQDYRRMSPEETSAGPSVAPFKPATVTVRITAGCKAICIGDLMQIKVTHGHAWMKVLDLQDQQPFRGEVTVTGQLYITVERATYLAHAMKAYDPEKIAKLRDTANKLYQKTKSPVLFATNLIWRLIPLESLEEAAVRPLVDEKFADAPLGNPDHPQSLKESDIADPQGIFGGATFVSAPVAVELSSYRGQAMQLLAAGFKDGKEGDYFAELQELTLCTWPVTAKDQFFRYLRSTMGQATREVVKGGGGLRATHNMTKIFNGFLREFTLIADRSESIPTWDQGRRTWKLSFENPSQLDSVFGEVRFGLWLIMTCAARGSAPRLCSSVLT